MSKQTILILAVIFVSPLTLADTNYRLNSSITPIHYAVTITPYFDTNDDKAFTFDGEVRITLETKESNIKVIRLHATDLEINAKDILLFSDRSVIGLNPENPIQFVKEYTFLDLNLETPLLADVRYTLYISYRGSIREDLKGFYRSSYLENGVTKWMGVTQVEPVHARKVFPCFDEPQYKATFTLSIDRPENYPPCLANTKLQASVPQANGYVRDIFHPTPKMSTYLVAFIVSEFTAAEYAVNGTKVFGVYTRPEAKSQAAYAFDFGKRVEVALSEYLNYDYYSSDDNLKLDHVAIPDFSAGAMENWGLIKYRESLLLYVPEESTPYYKYRVAQIVAHETTHMWFGNLVTCHWWSNTWLNEGFANYFQDYITALIEPTVGSADQQVVGSVYSGLAADETPSASPISYDNVNSPDDISNHFGTISYQKAGSVIRMMHHLIGDEAFKTGLQSYLSDNKFNLGYPELMYSALDKGVQSTGSLQQYPGVTITEVMNSWISQPGHPVLEVNVDYDTGLVTLKQRRFYTNASYESNEIYQIPITYTTEQQPNFENTKPAFVMANKTDVLNVAEVKDYSWILFNIQETGFYRVNYDTHTWKIISEALKGEQRTNIHHINRAKIVNDLFAFLNADEVSFATLYQVLDFLKYETDYAVWNAAINGLNALRTRFIGDEVESELDNYILELMTNAIEYHGYAEKASDEIPDLRNRMQIIEFACKIGHQQCIDNAVDMFKKFKETNTKIPPSLRPMAYCNGLRHGDASDFDFLWQKILESNVANDALIIYSALGCTQNKEKLEEYLLSVIKEDSPIRFQDNTVPVTSILAYHDNAELVLSFLENNYNILSSVYESISTVVNYVPPTLHSDAQFEKFEKWLDACSECSSEVKESGRTGVAGARAALKWASDHKSDIVQALRNASVLTSPDTPVIA